MGIGCSCNDPCVSPWVGIKSRLKMAAERRKKARRNCMCMKRPRFLRIRRKTRQKKKKCSCQYKFKCCCAQEVLSAMCVGDYKNKCTCQDKSKCCDCTQEIPPAVCESVGDLKKCTCQPKIKYCTPDASVVCESQATSPELSPPVKNVCRFTVDAYFT